MDCTWIGNEGLGFSPSFKAKVALESVQGLRTISELAQKHILHPTQINLWKKQLLDGAEVVFESGNSVTKPYNMRESMLNRLRAVEANRLLEELGARFSH